MTVKMADKTLTFKDTYSTYEREVKGSPVDQKTYIDINKRFMKFLVKKVLLTFEIALPFKFGYLSIVGKKRKPKLDEDGNIVGLPVDWKATKELWKRDLDAKLRKKKIFHLNPHTDGYSFKWKWSKKILRYKFKTLYSLQLARDNKRAVPILIDKGIKYKTT